MRKALKCDTESILRQIEKNIGNHLYLYIDIKKYGLDNPNMEVWIDDSNGEISKIVMKYFDSMQLYISKKGQDLSDVWALILNSSIRMVSGHYDVIQKLAEKDGFSDIFDIASGYVFQFKEYQKFSCEEQILIADEGDMGEIADLICLDPSFSLNYQAENLASQLLQRMQTKMGRNYVIRKNEKIIAHIATYAEAENIAVTSGLIVHPDYRSFPYGTVLESYLVNRLWDEKFEVYTFVNEKKRIKWLKALKCDACGQYGKITRK